MRHIPLEEGMYRVLLVMAVFAAQSAYGQIQHGTVGVIFFRKDYYGRR
jgi:hypothetical protein